MKFKIVNMGSEEFFKYLRRSSRLSRVPGTEKVLKYVNLHSSNGDVVVKVRGKTSLEVAATARALLGITAEQWRGMVARYRDLERAQAYRLEVRRARHEARELRRTVREGERAKKELEKRR